MRGHDPCPHCGQRMMYMREGARLPPLKTRIFDAIKRAGPDGISYKDLLANYELGISFNSLRVHVWQINEILERYGSSRRIVSPQWLGRAYRTYRVVDKKELVQ